MLKRIISVIFALSLPVCICGCGASAGKNSESYDDNSSKSEETSSVVSDVSSETVSSKPMADQTLFERKMVALTFDDGPQETNPQLLDILKEKGAKGTFFMLGKNMEAYPEIVKRAIEEGHDVGWHSYDHKVSRTSSRSFVSEDFDKAQPIIDQIVSGYKITLMRGPGGAASDIIKEEATARDWRLVNWSNYGFNDNPGSSVTPQDRISKVFEGTGVRNGEVLLIHPRNNQELLEGISLLIDKLQADGFECVTISELLKRRNGGIAGILYGWYNIY